MTAEEKDRLEAARQRVMSLARALAADDFAAARSSLAAGCRHHARGGETLHGPEAILASYAASSAWARRTFDDVRYESEVGAAVAEAGGVAVPVVFTDYLIQAGGRAHRYRCRQRFVVGPDGLVVGIVHEDLPGEREALTAFFAACGVTV